MKKLTTMALMPFIAAPAIAQGTAPMTYDDRITCGALMFLSSEEAEDPSTERQFGAHHVFKAIEMSGKAQAVVIAETEQKMEKVKPRWQIEDAALMETYTGCISAVITEMRS